jgi:hypothetical protein
MALWFLAGELRGITTLGLIWLASAGRDTRTRRRRVYRLRQRWCGGHLAGVRRLFGLRFEIEDLELASPGPVLVLIRHASIIDNTLPDAIIGAAHDLGLRFVIKRELETDPRHRRRRALGADGRSSAAGSGRHGPRARPDPRRLGTTSGPTRAWPSTPRARGHTTPSSRRAKEILAERRRTLLPLGRRPAARAPSAPGGPDRPLWSPRATRTSFVCGHVGLDGFEYVSDIWRGGLVGTTGPRASSGATPAGQVPADPTSSWPGSTARWQELDDWVGRQRA